MKRLIMVLLLCVSNLWAMDAHERMKAIITSKFKTVHPCNDKCNTVLECYKKKSISGDRKFTLAMKCRFNINGTPSESSQSIVKSKKIKKVRGQLFDLSLCYSDPNQQLYYAVFAHDKERVQALLKQGAAGEKIAKDYGTDIFGARFENILFYMARILNKYEEYTDRFDKREFQQIFEIIVKQNPYLLEERNAHNLTPLDILEQTHNNFKNICYPDEQSAYEIGMKYKPNKPLNRARRRTSRRLPIVPQYENSEESD